MKQGFIEDNIIILSKQTIDNMLKGEHPSDLIGLYCFYYYTAKWQKTNIVKCSTAYVSRGLNWRKEKVIQSKKELKKLGLIEDKQAKNEKGQIIGWYIKVNYIWKKETIKNQKVAEPEGGNRKLSKTSRVEKPVGGDGNTNALSVDSLNALNANKINSDFKKIASPALKRKDFKIKSEIYKELTDSYQQYRGIKLNGAEFGEVKRAIKTMIYSGRTKENIIDFMKFCADVCQKLQEGRPEYKKFEWLEGWTILTIKKKLPFYLAGQIGKVEEEIEIPDYAKNWQK